MNEPDIHPMTLLQLAVRWGVSVRTVKRWIKPFEHELGRVEGKIFTPRQVKIIFEHLE